jgi:hypothetical protein
MSRDDEDWAPRYSAERYIWGMDLKRLSWEFSRANTRAFVRLDHVLKYSQLGENYCLLTVRSRVQSSSLHSASSAAQSCKLSFAERGRNPLKLRLRLTRRRKQAISPKIVQTQQSMGELGLGEVGLGLTH